MTDDTAVGLDLTGRNLGSNGVSTPLVWRHDV